MSDIKTTSVTDINARIDRLPAWGLSYWSLNLLGLTYFFAYFDITVIGVTMPAIVKDFGISEAAAGGAVTANLIGYMVGAYCLGTVADYIGRQRALRICVVILTIGAVLTSLSWDLPSLTGFRFLTGVGIGAQISLAATWMGELSSRDTRGRNIGRNAIWGGLGFLVPAFLALGLLTLGHVGWRVLFGLGALIVVLLAFLNDRWLPESPRWLTLHGKHVRAEAIAARMEAHAVARTGQPLPPVDAVPAEAARSTYPTAELLRSYPGRLFMVFAWFFIVYMAIYAFLSYEPTVLVHMGISEPKGLLFTALGLIGFPLGAIIQSVLVDRVQRKYLMTAGLAVEVVGFLLLAFSSGPASVVLGGFLVTLADFSVVITGYAYAAEIFPTRARASAMAICDGLGHLGGAVQPFIVLPVLFGIGPRSAFGFMVVCCVAAVIVMLSFGRRTTGQPLTQLSR